jgi:hypothetical protein
VWSSTRRKAVQYAVASTITTSSNAARNIQHRFVVKNVGVLFLKKQDRLECMEPSIMCCDTDTYRKGMRSECCQVRWCAETVYLSYIDKKAGEALVPVRARYVPSPALSRVPFTVHTHVTTIYLVKRSLMALPHPRRF